MMNLMERNGFAQPVMLVLLLVGIFIGVFLVTQKTQLFSDASELASQITTPSCSSDNQCSLGAVCKRQVCANEPACLNNPKSAFCKIKLKFCGGRCVSVSTESASPAASFSAKPKISPSPKPKSTAPTYSPRPRVSGQVCIQVITKACANNKDLKSCQIFATPCDIPDGWTISP
jgi:hypothetical protein